MVILYLTSQFNHYCTVVAQIPVPKTENEWKNMLQVGGLRDINCNRRISRDTECAVSVKSLFSDSVSACL